jgi:hypothetical protein
LGASVHMPSLITSLGSSSTSAFVNGSWIGAAKGKPFDRF